MDENELKTQIENMDNYKPNFVEIDWDMVKTIDDIKVILIELDLKVDKNSCTDTIKKYLKK